MTDSTKECDTSKRAVWLQRQCVGCEMTKPHTRNTQASYHGQTGNSGQKDMLQNSILRRKNNPKTDLICNKEKKIIHILCAWGTEDENTHTELKAKHSAVFRDFALKLTFFNKVNGKIFGCRVHALQLQVAPGKQAALDGPEQGEEHRANLPLGPIEHQQLTLQGRRQMESVYKAIHRTQPRTFSKGAAVTDKNILG